MADAHKNFAYTTVTSAPSPATSGTSMTVADGTVLPAVPFNATVWVTGANPLNSNAEIVRVTNRSGNDLTILRAQEGSTARAIVVGDQFAATITAQTLTDAELTISDGTNTQGSGTIRLSNANGLSFGLNAGTLTASHNGLTTAALSNHSHGNPQLNLTNLSGTTASNSAGLTLSLSANPAQTVQPGIQSVSAGTTRVTTGEVVWSNANGVSFGANGQTITASHNGLTTARASNDGIGLNTAQSNVTWTVNSAGLSLDARGYAGTGTSATNASVTLNSNGLAISVAAPGGGGNFSAGVSNVGNTGGDTGVTGTRLVFVGSQNITLNQATDANGATISISGGAGAAGNTGFISAGGATASLGTVVFSNSNGVSFGVNGQTVTASHNGLTTARASNDAVGLNTALTAGPLAWTVNSSGISLNAGSAAGTTSGFAGNLISGSMTHNTAGLNLSLNHPAWLTTAMQSNAVTLSNIRVSAGTTSNLLSALTFNDANGISFGLNASTLTASHNGLTSQSNQNVTVANGGFAFQTLSFSNVNGISFGTSAGSAITASHNGLTTARASNDGIGLGTAQTNVTWTVNSGGLSLDAAGYAGTGTTFAGANISASMTLNSNGLNLSASVAAPGGGLTPVASASNGSFSFTTLAFSNANNVTFGTSAGSIITASVAAPGAAAEQNAVNLLGANTAGNTTATGSTIGWSGQNLTLSGTNGSQVVISAPATSSLSATGILSISTNGSTISLGVPAGTATMWQPFNEGVNVLGQQGQATMQLVPLPTPVPAALGELHVDRLVVPLYWSNSSNSTGTVTLSLSFGLYTKTASTLSLAMSTSYSTAWTFSGTVSSATYNGIRLHTIPWTTTIGDGRYYVAQWVRTTTGGGNGTLSQVLVSQINSNFSGVFGLASNRSHQWPAGYGVYSASITTAMPSSVVFSQIDGTASLAARPPSFFMINGTV